MNWILNPENPHVGSNQITILLSPVYWPKIFSIARSRNSGPKENIIYVISIKVNNDTYLYLVSKSKNLMPKSSISVIVKS